MAEEKNLDEMKQALQDDELENVTGGTVYDRKGRYVGEESRRPRHFLDPDDKIWSVRYFPCSKCGRPMHPGTAYMWYCDPCDRWEFNPDPNYFHCEDLQTFIDFANTGC